MIFNLALNFLRIFYQKLKLWCKNRSTQKQLDIYIKNDRQPWSIGYDLFKESLIKQSINSHSTIADFLQANPLGKNYGEFIDERIVEYPWLISRISPSTGKLLDAGSILNFDYIVSHDSIKNKELTIVTLEPEPNCFWQRRISYLFSDLRDLPFTDNLFDEVVSISTVEHIGMNNSLYSANPDFMENDRWGFLKAIVELKRVVKAGGKVYISVPYGKYTDFGWYQQFDTDMIDALIEAFSPSKIVETYFCYENDGWDFSTKHHCADVEGFNIHDTKHFNPNSTKDYDPDFAACSRGIAALELWK